MLDTCPKATYVARLLGLLQEDPSPDRVRALLDQAQRAGVKPAGLYLSALRLHPRDLPLPPDPRLVLEVPAAGRRLHGAPEVLAGHRERGLVCARVLVSRARDRCEMARRRPHGGAHRG